MRGVSNMDTGFPNMRGYLPRSAATLAEMLREEGYATFATGKWHNGESSLLDGFQQGKAIYMGGMSDHEEVFLQDVVAGHRSRTNCRRA